MYWFTILYYENTPEQYVRPVVDSNNVCLLIYAENPEQSTDIAMQIIAHDPRYDHHLSKIGILHSCVHEDEITRWITDHTTC